MASHRLAAERIYKVQRIHLHPKVLGGPPQLGLRCLCFGAHRIRGPNSSKLVILVPLCAFLHQGPTISASCFLNIDLKLAFLFLVKLYFVFFAVFPPRHQCGCELVIFHQSHRIAATSVSEADTLEDSALMCFLGGSA